MSERFRDSVTQNSSVTSSYLRRKRSILPSNTFVLDNDLGNLSDDWWLHIPSDVLPKQRRVSILTDNTVVNNLESPFHDWHRYINRRKAKVPETSYDKSLSDSQHAFVKTENSFHHEKDEGGPGSRSSSPKSNLHQGSADRKSRRRVKHSNNRFKDFSAENSDLGSSSMTVSKQYSANADSSFLRSPVGQDALHVDIREEREEVSKSGEVSLKRTLNDKKNVKGRGSALGLNSMMSPKSMLRNSIEDKVNDNSENFTFQEGDLQGNFQRFTHQNRSRTRNRFRDLQVDDTDITEEMEPRQSVMYNINNDAVVDDEVISRNFEPKYDQEPSNLSVSKGNLQEESSPMENIQGYIKNSSNTKNRFLDLEVIDSDTAELVRTRDSMPNDADEVSNLLFSKTTQSKKSNPENKTLSSNRKTRSNTNNRFCDVDTYDSDSTELMSLSKSTKYNLSNSSNVRNAETSTSVVRNFLNDVEISNGSMGGNNELKHNNSKEKISTSIHKTQGPLKNRFHDLEINDSDTTASIIQFRRSKTNEVSNVLMSTNYRKEKNRRLLAKPHSNTNNHRFRDLEIDDSDTTESLSSSQFMAKNVSDTSNFLASRKNELGKSLSKDKTQVPRQQAFKITENRFIDFQMDDSDSTETSKSRKSILKNVNESSNLFLTENVASQKGYPDGMIQVSTHKATPKNDAKNTKNRFNNINQFVDDSDSSDEEKTEILPTQSPGKSSATNDSIRKPSQSSLMVVHSSGKLPAKSNDSYQLPRSSLINTENNLNLSLEVSDSYSDEEKEKSLSKPKKARHSLRKSKSTDLTSGVKSRNSFVESSSGKSPTRFSSEISLLENSTRKSPKKNSSTVLTSERKSNSSLMENSPRRSPRKNNSTVPTSGRKSSTRLVDSSPRRSLRKNNSTVPTSGRKTRSSFVKNSSRQSSSSDRSSISPPGRTSRNSSVENSPRKSPRKNSSTVLTSERKSNSSLMENSPRRSPRKNNSTVPTSERKSSTRLVDSSPRRSLRENNSTVPTSGRKTRSSFVKNSSRQLSSNDRSSISPPGRTSRNSSLENSPSRSQRENNSTVLTSGRKTRSSFVKNFSRQSSSSDRSSISPPGRTSRNSSVENSPRKSPRKNSSTVLTSERKSNSSLMENSPRRSPRKNNSTVLTSGRKTRSSFVKNFSRPSSSSDRSSISPPGRTSRNSSVENSKSGKWKISGRSLEKDSLKQSPLNNSYTILTPGTRSRSSVVGAQSLQKSPGKTNSSLNPSSDQVTEKSPNVSHRMNHISVRMSVGNSLRDIYSLERTPTKSKNYSQFPNQSLRNYKKKLIISPDDSDRSSDEEAEKTLRQSPKETSNSIHSSGRMLKSSVENMHSQETVSIKANSAIKFSDHTSKNDEPPRQSFIKSIKTIHSAGQMSKSSLESLRSLGSLPVKGNNDLKNFDQSLKKMTVMTPDDPSGAQILEKNNLFQSLEDESPTYQAYERSDNVNSLKNYKRSEHFGNAIENPNDFIHSKDSMNLKSSVGVGADKRSQSNLNESSVENRSKKSLDEITELSKGGEIKDNLSVNHQPSGNLNTVSAASLTKSQKQLKVSEQFSRKYDVNKGPSSSVSQSSPIIGTLGSKRRNRKISDHLHRVESASNSNNVHDKLVSGRKQVDTENEDVSEFQKDYIENEVVEVSSNVRTSIQKLSMHALHKSAHDTEMDLIDKNSSATSNFTERLLIPIAQSTIIGSKGSTPKKSTANKTYGSKSALSKKLTRNQGNTSYENSSLPLDEHALANNSSDSEIRSETLSPFQEKMKTLTKSGKISSGIENPVDGSSQRKMRDTKQHVKHESLVKTADAKKGQKEVNKNQRHSFSLQNMSPYHIVADNKKSNDTAKRSSLKRKSSVAVLTLKQSHINYKTTPKALLKSNISEHQRRDSSSSGMSVDDDDALEIDSSDDTMEKHPDIKNLLEEYTQPPKNADVTNHHTRGTLPYYFLPVNAAKTNIKETIPVKRKSTKPAKSVNPDKICDGVVYKKPRLAMPAPWVNKRLYKKVTQAFSADLEENEIVSNIKVEKYILKLHDMVKSVLKHIPSKKKGNGDEKVLAVMRHLYRAKLIRCKMDFYRFCSDYFPEELLIRARLYPFPNGPSIPSPKDGFLSAKYLLMDLNL